jgi:hypothetical protein
VSTVASSYGSTTLAGRPSRRCLLEIVGAVPAGSCPAPRLRRQRPALPGRYSPQSRGLTAIPADLPARPRAVGGEVPCAKDDRHPGRRGARFAARMPAGDPPVGSSDGSASLRCRAGHQQVPAGDSSMTLEISTEPLLRFPRLLLRVQPHADDHSGCQPCRRFATISRIAGTRTQLEKPPRHRSLIDIEQSNNNLKIGCDEYRGHCKYDTSIE